MLTMRTSRVVRAVLLAVAFLSALWLHLWAVPVRAQDPVTRELQIKAAFIYNFAKYAEWPDGAFMTPSSPFVLCVFGTPAITPYLNELNTRLVQEHPIQVTNGSDPKHPHCHLAYIPELDEASQQSAYKVTASDRALTVTDGDGPAAIVIVRGDNAMRFQVNLRYTSDRGVRLSSQLLKLAQSVRSD